MQKNLPSDISQLLGGLAPAQFLADYWHKKSLLIRRAVPDMAPVLSKADLLRLSGRDDVESRLVERDGRRWTLENGPFSAARFRRMASLPWTLLVQGANLHCAAADALLHRFDFIPLARQDDLMISYAVDGGGVGPHFDSYDVFLLQAHGRRRWRISSQRDRTLVSSAPLKILSAFKAQDEHVLEPGDMLYLPPGCAHEGVALGECMTYSIGFRAPSATELARGMLEHLADTVQRDGFYADPHLLPARQPAHLDDAYVRQAARLIGSLAPTHAQIETFLGCSLTEPKPNVFFDPPAPAMKPAAFARRAARSGIRLDLKTRMLHRGSTAFINGESVRLPAAHALLAQLADRRRLPPGAPVRDAAMALIYAWYTHGWVHSGETS